MSTKATRIPSAFKATTQALQRLVEGNEPVRLILPRPPSLNALYRAVGGRSIMSKDYRAWIKLAEQEAMLQKPRLLKGRVGVYVEILLTDKRRRDIDNFGFKAVIDLLKKIGVIEDDDSRFVRVIHAKWVDAGPTCAVTVKRMLD